MVRSKVWALTAFLVFALAGLAGAAEIYVPTDYATITEALAVANPGDTIVVTPAYDSAGETFPILIQKDNVTIRAQGSVVITGDGSSAVFVIGAAKEFVFESTDNCVQAGYEDDVVTGVTVEGFTIGDPEDAVVEDIAIVVKNAAGAKVLNNRIIGTLEGIRIVHSTGTLVEGNEVTEVEGIGIFLQESTGTTLKGNEVAGCGLGLFVYKSANTLVDEDVYVANENGGVVLNDSLVDEDGDNVLQNLHVAENGGWGVRFVFSDGNKLLNSWIEKNAVGGVELLGSQNNLVEGNIVFDNGLVDGIDDAQIVVTHGDKAEFDNRVFADYNDLAEEGWSDFEEEKAEVCAKLDLLSWWVAEIDTELWTLRQKVAAAIGAIDQEQTPSDLIQSAIDEKHFIADDDPPIDRAEWESEHRPAALADVGHNFTLEAAKEGFHFEGLSYDKLDFYEDGKDNDFGLDYDYDNDPDTPDPEDHMSWDKLGIVSILISAIRGEIWNNFSTGWQENTIDSLKEKLQYLYDKGLITDDDKAALDEKLDAALGFLAQIEEIKDALVGKFDDFDDSDVDTVDEYLEDALAKLEAGDRTGAKEALLAAKDLIEDAIAEKQEIYDLIEDIRFKLCLVDLELPPFPEVNTTLVGKKEKPFAEIDTTDQNNMVTAIRDALNDTDTVVDTTQEEILNSVTNGAREDFALNDISVDHKGLRHSTGNTIASNLVTSDHRDARQIGIVIECPDNKIVNNLITNERVKPIDEETVYGEEHTLDVAIILLANDNAIAYNAIEWVDTGIVRGGVWRRKDVQTEYVFEKLAQVAYWPEPGLSRTGCDDPTTEENDPVTYTADHFERRPTAWLPVLVVRSAPVTIDPTQSARVKGNRIALNFFEYCGWSIDILDAESNVIDENLFYNCSNGIKFRKAGDHPWYGKDVQIKGAGPNIVLEKNDYYSGTAVDNDTDDQIDASRDYTPPAGQPGHATVSGEVNPPAAPTPHAPDNFGTIVKYVMLGIEKYYPGDDAAEILPPNLAFFYEGVVLPPEKPRHPDTIFVAVPPVVCLSETFPAYWNMISSPVIPEDPDPMKVFGDDVLTSLVMWEWNGTEYVEPTQIEGTRGYWIWLLGEATLDVCGEAPETNVEFVLDWAGWHMISTLTTPVYLNKLVVRVDGEEKIWDDAVSAGWVRPFAYWWDPVAEDYMTVLPDNGVLMPWRGYWIKTLVDNVTIVLPIEYSLENPPEVPTESLGIKATTVSDELPPPPPPAPTPDLSAIDVVNEPNPVRDVNTTVFKVVGPAAAFVEAMRVRIFDASGRLVYEAEVEGPELVWHTQDLTGAYLANGVYLYRVEVKVAGQWITTEVKKLAIYR